MDTTAPEWDRTAEAAGSPAPAVAVGRARAWRGRLWPRDAGPEVYVLRVGIAVTAVFMVLTAFDVGGQVVLWENGHWTAAGTLAAVYAGLVARRSRGLDRQIAVLVAIGTMAWLIGQFAWDVQTALGYFNVPAPSDVGYLMVAPPIIVAFVVAVYGRLAKAEEVAVYLDAIAIFLALASIILAIYGDQVGAGESAGGTVAMIYPIVHLAAAAAGLVALLAARAAPRGGGYLLLLGFAILGFAWVDWLRQAVVALPAGREPGQLRLLVRDRSRRGRRRQLAARRRPRRPGSARSPRSCSGACRSSLSSRAR